MFSKIANFITKIQNSDDTTKKIWLVILSGAAMTIVIILWLVNLNAGIQSASGQTATQKTATAGTAAENQEIGKLKAIFSAGLKTVTGKIKEKTSSQNEIYLQTSEQNFILENLKKLPKTSIL